MNRFGRLSCRLSGTLFLFSPFIASAQPALPVLEGQEAVATVNGRPITWEAFENAFAAVHAMAEEGRPVVHKQNPQELLDRLVTVKLVVLEAREMGLDQLPDLKKALEIFERDTIKRMLYLRQTQGLQKAGREHVERLYRKETQVFRLSSVMIEKESEARKFLAAVQGGGDFDKLAAEWAKAGRAHPGDKGELVKDKEILPEIEKVVAGMKPGTVSPPIKIPQGFAVVRLLESTRADDPAALAQAEADALKEEKVDALKKYTDGLIARYVKLDQKLYDALDFESPRPGFAALRQDNRVLAAIQGGEPLLVSYLAEALERKFFHGVEGAIKNARLNARKGEVLEEILMNRVAVLEGRKLGIDKTPEFKARRAAHEEELLFGAFVVKAIDPGIVVTEADVKNYFQAHGAEYTTVPLIVLDGLAFRQRALAEQALSRLRRGADFAWVRANSAEVLDHKKDASVMEFNPGPGSYELLEEEVRKVVTGAASGEYRFYSAPNGLSYVLYIKEVVPARPVALETVRDRVQQAVTQQKREAALKDYAAKLRQAVAVKTFATGEQLNQLIQKRLGPGR